MIRLSARLLVMAATLATPALGQSRYDVRRAVAPDVYVRINGAYAQLKVTTWAHDSLALVADLPKGTRFDPAVPTVKDPPAKGVKFYIEAPPGGGGATGSIELFVPPGATVWAKAANARMDVSGITGGLDLNVVGGSVAVSGNPRQLNVESMDGSVSIVGSPDWIRVKTATGDVTMRGSSPDAGITTVGGAVRLSEGTFERLRIESISGGVTFAATMARAGNLTVDSHAGDIELQLAPKASLDIEATTIAGTILNNVSARRPTPGREGRGEELSLGLGIGDARATVRSFKGTIRLSRR
jgi:hypothetical protein